MCLKNLFTIILFKIWPTNGFSKAKSYNFDFHKNDVTWPLSANGQSIVNIIWICLGLRRRGWMIATIRDTSSWHTCLKWLLLSTISFIYCFIPFKCGKSTHPKINVVWSKRKTWGSKIQTGEGDRYVHYTKRGHFMGSVLTLLSLTVGPLACIHITKAEQWASVCLELV